MNPHISMRIQVQSLASLSCWRIRHCCKLSCRSQAQFISCIAMTMVYSGSYSLDLTPSLRTSICCICGPKKTKPKKYRKRRLDINTKKFKFSQNAIFLFYKFKDNELALCELWRTENFMIFTASAMKDNPKEMP